VQREIVGRAWSDDGATDDRRPHADTAGGGHWRDAADAAAGGRATRRRGRAGRDAGRQLLDRQPRHGRRVVRAATDEGRARAPVLAARAVPASRTAAIAAAAPTQPNPSQQVKRNFWSKEAGVVPTGHRSKARWRGARSAAGRRPPPRRSTEEVWFVSRAVRRWGWPWPGLGYVRSWG
jgi:hypothetical protein